MDLYAPRSTESARRPQTRSPQLKYGASLVWVILLLTLLWASPPALAAGNANSKIYPVNAHPHGLSYAQWSARNWQWLFSLPVNAHPLLDTADCSAGQTGNVWFLGGTFAVVSPSPGVIVGEADRTCDIPSGTALFFAPVDVECSTIEGNGATETELRACANLLADTIVPGSLQLQIDGDPVTTLTNYRVESPLFTFGPLPANNVLEFNGVTAPAGATSPSVSDGYFVMVKPLPVGQHTIHYEGTADLTSIGGPLFIQDITYTINVVPRGQYGR